MKNPGGSSSLLQKLGVTPAHPSTPAKFSHGAAAAAVPPPPASASEIHPSIDATDPATSPTTSPSRVIIQDSQLPPPVAKTPAKAPASGQKRAHSPPRPAAPAPVAGFPPVSAVAVSAAPAAAEGDMAHVHKRMRAAAVEQVHATRHNSSAEPLYNSSLPPALATPLLSAPISTRNRWCVT